MFDVQSVLTIKGKLSSEKIKRLDDVARNQIREQTSFLPGDTSIITRLRYLVLGIDAPRTCKHCGQPMVEKTVDSHHYEYCSRSCMKSDVETILDKTRKTCKERYGIENFFQSNEFQEKMHQHWIDTCGVPTPFGLPEVREKREHTFISNYGVPNPMMNKEVAAKSTQRFSLVKHQAHKKARQTMLDRYGVPTPMQHRDFIEKFKQSRSTNYYNDRSVCLDAEEIKRLYEKHQTNLYQVINTSPSHMYTILKQHNIETSGRSFLEQFVSNFLVDLQIEHHRDRKINDDKYRFDIIIPNHKLVIETNGAYWHKEYDHQYHLDKMKSAAKSGYTLIYLQEHQIMSRPDACKNMISSKLGLNQKIYARKTEVKEISASDARAFCELNHIQGYRNSSINLGLYHNDELIQVACFAKPLFDRNHAFELTRMCSRFRTTVVGGASKLIKWFMKTYKASTLISYAQKDYSTGNVYEAIGFKKIADTPPSYFYSNGVKTYSRYQCQKHLLPKMIKRFSLELTEVQNMEQNGFFRLFDCGTSKYMISCILEDEHHDKKQLV